MYFNKILKNKKLLYDWSLNNFGLCRRGGGRWGSRNRRGWRNLHYIGPFTILMKFVFIFIFRKKMEKTRNKFLPYMVWVKINMLVPFSFDTVGWDGPWDFRKNAITFLPKGVEGHGISKFPCETPMTTLLLGGCVRHCVWKLLLDIYAAACICHSKLNDTACYYA